jgi:5-hydroxyisourate hydrolase-like protein (transthyretin family)
MPECTRLRRDISILILENDSGTHTIIPAVHLGYENFRVDSERDEYCSKDHTNDHGNFTLSPLSGRVIEIGNCSWRRGLKSHVSQYYRAHCAGLVEYGELKW